MYALAEKIEQNKDFNIVFKTKNAEATDTEFMM